MLVSLIGRSFLSEVERPSILRTGLPVAPSLFYRLATRLSAHAPAQRAGAQRLRALAQHPRSAYFSFAPETCRPWGNAGVRPERASIGDPAARREGGKQTTGIFKRQVRDADAARAQRSVRT